jgi:hypothetical protein
MPLIERDVVAGRVVAAGVQHDDRAAGARCSAAASPSKSMPRVAAS